MKITVEVEDHAAPSDVIMAVLQAWEQAKGVGRAAAEDWRRETGFPKPKLINGARIMARAPINPEWEPSSIAKTLSGGGGFVTDPSNPPGARSPAGFPTYAGKVMFADDVFDSDDALAAWRSAVAAQGNQGGVDAQQQATLIPGAVDLTRLNLAQLLALLPEYARNDTENAVRHPERYGPLAVAHQLSALMTASGIVEDPARPGYIVPPPAFPQLASLTVREAKRLAGLE